MGGISVAASTMQKEGYVSYRQGLIHVRDRVGLERICCECYAVIRAEFEGSGIFASPIDEVELAQLDA